MALVNIAFSDVITFARYSNATYVDSYGVVSYSGLDAPRFTYNPTTPAPLGLLIEEQRANYISSSVYFDIGWTYVNATINSFSAGSPDSSNLTSACYGIQPTDDVGTTALISFSVTKAATAITYTQSIWVKGNTSAFSFALDGNGVANRGLAVFDLIAGTLVSVVSEGSFSNTSATITRYVNNSWYRITLTTTSNTSTTIRFRCFYASNGGSTPVVYVYGPQLEEGAFATSYIVSDNTVAVRAADEAVINTLSPWYNATEGTVFAQFQSVNATLATQQGIWDLDNGTTNNVIYGARTATTNRFRYNSRSGGTVDVDGEISTVNIADGALAKTAVAIATNNYNLSLNGAVGTADTSAVVPTVNRMLLGNYIFSGNINGCLQKIVYYPKRLSDTELQALTS